ncbi:methyltransferase domain-containing protein, partial [Candidatus Woesearchaeota archaeon]
DSAIDKAFNFDRKKVIEALEIKPKDKILEIGVGTGLNLPHYPQNCTVYGIDFSKSMLERAREKKAKAKIKLLKADARSLEFQNSFFDKAIMTYTLRVSPQPKNSFLKQHEC